MQTEKYRIKDKYKLPPGLTLGGALAELASVTTAAHRHPRVMILAHELVAIQKESTSGKGRSIQMQQGKLTKRLARGGGTFG
ncbi:MAG: hypothetical protein RLZZ283_120 [Candidatus Parcubacteria bacterium]